MQHDLAERARSALDPSLSSWGDRRPRLVRTEGIHLTLVFFGSVDEERARRLERELGAQLEGARAPILEVGGHGAFPRRSRERVVWAGAREVLGQALQDLHERALRAGKRARLEQAERSQTLVPHLTLARFPRPAAVPSSFYAGRELWSWRPDEVRLLESVRMSSGPPRHERVAAWPLRSPV